MNYLLDTNVISETVRVKPNQNVLNWFSVVPSESLFVSVLTLGEIRRGIELLTDNKQRPSLVLWLDQKLPLWFGENVLSIDQEVAERWGYITSKITKKNQLSAIDTLLAATALRHNLKMVTRNVKDFDLPGLEVINPFE